jgi:hypothetical protein
LVVMGCKTADAQCCRRGVCLLPRVRAVLARPLLARPMRTVQASTCSAVPVAVLQSAPATCAPKVMCAPVLEAAATCSSSPMVAVRTYRRGFLGIPRRQLFRSWVPTVSASVVTPSAPTVTPEASATGAASMSATGVPPAPVPSLSPLTPGVNAGVNAFARKESMVGLRVL